MMIEISLQKLSQIANVICTLHPLELLLQANILRRFHVCKHLLPCLLIDPHLFHCQYLVDLRPLRIRLYKQVLSSLPYSCFLLHSFNHFEPSLDLLACSFVLFSQVISTPILTFFFFLLIEAQGTIGLSTFLEKGFQFFFVVELLTIHTKYGIWVG